MDREPQELQYLGVVGILAESFRILRSCFNSMGSITLTLALPLCFVILAHDPFTHLLFQKLASEKFFFHVETHQIYVEWGAVLLIELSYVAFSLPCSLLSTSAVVYSVACIHAGKKLSYARVISAVPRVWRRVMITSLWFVALIFAYYIYVAIVLVIFLWISMKLSGGVFWFLVVVITVVMLFVHVYISMVWQLANVVSIVEDKYGVAAMKKSKDLIKGKCGATLALNIIYLITVGISSQLFEFVVVHGGTHDGALLVVLQCVVNLMWLLSQSVFYFVCKSFHDESIDKLGLSDHLEGYLEEYIPLKDIQLEHQDRRTNLNS